MPSAWLQNTCPTMPRRMRTWGWPSSAPARWKRPLNASSAIRFNPRAVSAHVNFGNTLKESGRYEAAESSYRRALELNPDLVEEHNNLGNILRERGRIEEAPACYRRALELRPGMPEAVNNLGRLLKDLGRFADAEACFRQALANKPDYADAHYNLGSVVYDQGRTAEAAEHCARALELVPDNTMLRIGQAVMRLPVIPESLDEAEQAASAFGRALGELSGWMASAPTRRIDPSVLLLPFYLAYRKGNHLDCCRVSATCARTSSLPRPRRMNRARKSALRSSQAISAGTLSGKSISRDCSSTSTVPVSSWRCTTSTGSRMKRLQPRAHWPISGVTREARTDSTAGCRRLPKIGRMSSSIPNSE